MAPLPMFHRPMSLDNSRETSLSSGKGGGGSNDSNRPSLPPRGGSTSGGLAGGGGVTSSSNTLSRAGTNFKGFLTRFHFNMEKFHNSNNMESQHRYPNVNPTFLLPNLMFRMFRNFRSIEISVFSNKNKTICSHQQKYYLKNIEDNLIYFISYHVLIFWLSCSFSIN